MELLYKPDSSAQDFTVTDAILILAMNQEKPIFSFLSFPIISATFITDISGSRLNQFAAERKARLRDWGVLEQSTKKAWLGRESTKETVKPEFVDRIIKELRAELPVPA